MPYTIKPGSFKYKKSNGQFSEIDCFEGPDSPVTDVQINGTTILDAQGVANMPVAGIGTLGVVKTSAAYGLSVDSNGRISASPASSADIKNPDSNYKIVGINRQHESTFYGLAKASGDITQSSSSNPVGQYTEDALIKIQKMLGIRPKYGDLEFIKEVTLTEDMDTVSVVTDMNGLPFKLVNAQIVLVFGTGVTGINDYITAAVIDSDGVVRTLPTLRILQSSFTWLVYDFIQFGGIPIAFAKATSTGNSQPAQMATFHTNTPSNERGGTQPIQYITGVKFNKYSETTTPIISGSRIVIYGNRVIED